MDIVANHSDYLKRRLSGERVICAATMYGITALKQMSELKDFGVLSLGYNTYSSYVYHVKNGKFRITESHESQAYGLSEFLLPDLCNNQTTIRWWKCVFFEQDENLFYDAAYDDLSIAENSIITFKDIIQEAYQVLSRIEISQKVSHILLTGELGCNPLLHYILQVLYTQNVIVLDSIPNRVEGIDENKCVYIPQKQLEKYTLSCINNIEISSLVSCPIKITIPLDSSKESIMLGGVRWKDILVDEQNYYSTDDIDFKQILLSFDYDSMNNMFVIGEDMYNHRKVQKIN